MSDIQLSEERIRRILDVAGRLVQEARHHHRGRGCSLVGESTGNLRYMGSGFVALLRELEEATTLSHSESERVFRALHEHCEREIQATLILPHTTTSPLGWQYVERPASKLPEGMRETMLDMPDVGPSDPEGV